MPFGITQAGASIFHDSTQGALGIAGTFALVLGAILYVTERRDKPRVTLEPTATVVAISPLRRSGRDHNVLVQISVRIENRGERGRWFNCAAIDVIGLRGSEDRTNPYPDDLAGTSLLPASANDSLWMNCVGRFEAASRTQAENEIRARTGAADSVNPPAVTGTPSTGARYRDFFMEPGETTTKTWEQLVPCRYRAIRVIFKLPKPGSWQDYETKILVPIADVCRGERLVASYPQIEADRSR